MVSVTRKMNEHTNMCLVASKKRWRQLWHNALEISKGFELQVANFSNLSLSRVQETDRGRDRGGSRSSREAEEEAEPAEEEADAEDTSADETTRHQNRKRLRGHENRRVCDSK
jgi:hypothetical protein